MTYLYSIILALFGIGWLLMKIINRKKSKTVQKENWLKFFTYFIIVNIVILSILYNSTYFYYIALLIILSGLLELLRATYASKKLFVGMISLFIFIPIAFVFLKFSQLHRDILLFTYLVVTIFDASSQLTGQLFGNIRLVPTISPNKTLEGFVGGFVSTSFLSLLFSGFLETSLVQTFVISIAICVFAFFGDFLASLCKRHFNIKDFSKVLPGQGGILDRFDSLIFSSLLIVLLHMYQIL